MKCKGIHLVYKYHGTKGPKFSGASVYLLSKYICVIYIYACVYMCMYNNYKVITKTIQQRKIAM